MTYQEKKSIVTLISTILIFIVYCLYKYPAYPQEALDSKVTFHYWGSFVLVLTLVSIAPHIVISIIFNIVFRITTGRRNPHSRMNWISASTCWRSEMHLQCLSLASFWLWALWLLTSP